VPHASPSGRLERETKARSCGQCAQSEGGKRRTHGPAIAPERVFTDGVLGRIQVAAKTVKRDECHNKCSNSSDADDVNDVKSRNPLVCQFIEAHGAINVTTRPAHSRR
jgi:hypothetical protein